MTLFSMKTLLNHLAVGCCVAAGTGVATADVLYSDSFAGTGLLNGVLVEDGALQNGSVAWAANSAFNADGTINGADEGGAYLPFQPLINSQYTLSMDVLNPTDRWVALGFARDPIASPGASDLADRLSNEAEGIAWMLYRNNGAQRLEFLYCFRRRGYAAFTRGPFLQDRDPHSLPPNLAQEISRMTMNVATATVGTVHLSKVMKPP